MSEVGDWLKKHRKLIGASLQKVADASNSNIKPETIRLVENGVNIPRESTLRSIMRGLRALSPDNLRPTLETENMFVSMVRRREQNDQDSMTYRVKLSMVEAISTNVRNSTSSFLKQRGVSLSKTDMLALAQLIDRAVKEAING